MSYLDLVPAPEIEEEILCDLERELAVAFEISIRRRPHVPDPPEALDEKRGQYSSPAILQALTSRIREDTTRLLGITNRDLFIPMLTFIFGQAQLGGRTAVVSLARLRQEFYGLPGDRSLLLERIRKEAMHELGHTFRLTHCLDGRCVMSLSTDITQVDRKKPAFCASCEILLRDGIAAARGAGRT